MVAAAFTTSTRKLCLAVIAANQTKKFTEVTRLLGILANELHAATDAHRGRESRIPSVPTNHCFTTQQDGRLTTILQSASYTSSSKMGSDQPPLSLANATYGETPPLTIQTLLHELALKHNNGSSTFSGRFIDAGSGNGIATVTAALDGRFSRCTGIEYDSKRFDAAIGLQDAYDSQKQSTVLDFRCADLTSASFDGASVVFANCVCWDARLCATMGRQLERAILQPNALIVSISRRFPCPSFDLVDIMKMPCNGGEDFTFYVTRRCESEDDVTPLVDARDMCDLLGDTNVLNQLVSIASTGSWSKESMSFLAALCASEPMTRILTQNSTNVLMMLADSLLPHRSLAVRASSSIVLRGMSEHPIGRRRLAECSATLAALICRARTDPRVDVPEIEHPAIKANVVDILGQILNDSVGNENLGELGIDNILAEALTEASRDGLLEVVESCKEAMSLRQWWQGEARHVRPSSVF